MSIESITAVKLLGGVSGIMAVETVGTMPIELYEKFGLIGLLIAAIYVLWVADQRRQSKLEEIIKENTQVMTEVRDALRFCASKNGR